MATYQEWLNDSTAIRIILVVAKAGVYNGSTFIDTLLYFSNHAFMTGNSSIAFNPIITGSVSLRESLSDTGNIAMSFGDVELLNTSGELDNYLDSAQYVWTNKPIQIYYGDARWTFDTIAATNFFKIFDGIVEDVDSPSRNTLALKFRDKLERLNAPVSENKIGTYGVWSGGQQNTDTLRPVVLGEVFNMSPVLIDPSKLEYMVSTGTANQSVSGFTDNGSCESIIEIRDNGVPVYTAGGIGSGAVVSLSTGTFKLTSPASGTITASVQGVVKEINLSTGAVTNTYNNNIVNLIAVLVTQFGKSTTDSRFITADLDLTNLAFYSAKFISEATQAAGILITSTTNVISVARELAASVGCQIFVNRLGKLQILRYGEGYNSSTAYITTITDSDILLNSMQIADRFKIEAATKLGYAKNWTVQADIVTSIPDAHKDTMGTEWLTATVKDTTIIARHSLSSDPVQKNTLLITKTSAENEATRLNNYYKQKRTVYRFIGTPRLLGLELGQTVTLVHSRFNLYNNGSGRSGQVVSLAPNFISGNVEVGVLI